jgi:hypothetical protein
LLGKLHKVPLDKVDLAGQPGLAGLHVRPLNLVIVDGDARDVCVGEAGDLPRGSTDTASDVEDAGAGGEVELVGEVVLVSGELEGQRGLERRGGRGRRDPGRVATSMT